MTSHFYETWANEGLRQAQCDDADDPKPAFLTSPGSISFWLYSKVLEP